jgi:hypothetical protein
VQVFSAGNSFSLSPRTTLQTLTSSQVLLAPISLVTADDLKASVSKENVVDVVVSVLERTA